MVAEKLLKMHDSVATGKVQNHSCSDMKPHEECQSCDLGWSHSRLLNVWACPAASAADDIFNTTKRDLKASLHGPGNHIWGSFGLVGCRECSAQTKVQPTSITKSLIVQGRLQILNDLITEFCKIKIVSLGSVQITKKGCYKKGILHICMQNTFIMDLIKSCRRKWDINEQVLKQRYMCAFVHARLCVQVSSVDQY